MAFPKILQRLFANNGAGPLLRADIIPTPAPVSPYELCTTIYSRLCAVSTPGFVPVNGTLIANAVNKYPQAWAYLQTSEGQQMCVSEAAWQALTRAIWHTNADGTRIGWNGVGGAAKYVIDVNAGTIRTPDLRGMSNEVAGYDSLGVGGVHGDGIRNIRGVSGLVVGVSYICAQNTSSGVLYFNNVAGKHSTENGGNRLWGEESITMDASRGGPIANKNQPRAWGSLACVYLG